MSFTPLAIFSEDAWGAGAGLGEGPATIIKARFCLHAFTTGAKQQNMLMVVAQPEDEQGNDVGEVKTAYYPAGDGTAIGNPVKGETGAFKSIGLAEDSKHTKLWNKSDCGQFMSYVLKAGKANPELFDLEAAQDDVTALDGVRVKFGKVVRVVEAKDDGKPKDPAAGSEVAKPKTFTSFVIEEFLPAAGTAAPAAATKKAPAAAKGKATPAPAANLSAEIGEDTGKMIEYYLGSALNDNAVGTKCMSLRLNLVTWAKDNSLDLDLAEAAKDEFKSGFATWIAKFGFKDAGGTLAKS